MCVCFLKKVSLHLMHGVDVLDNREASDSSSHSFGFICSTIQKCVLFHGR